MATPSGQGGNEQRTELVERYLDQQGKEIAIRAQELEIEKQKDNHNFEYGKAALAAQAEDRKHERECKVREIRHRHRLLIILSVILAGLILGAAWRGETQLAMEIAKSVGLLLAGGLGGYGYAKSKTSDADE